MQFNWNDSYTIQDNLIGWHDSDADYIIENLLWSGIVHT